jgi:hypothetical protein
MLRATISSFLERGTFWDTIRYDGGPLQHAQLQAMVSFETCLIINARSLASESPAKTWGIGYQIAPHCAGIAAVCTTFCIR